MKVIGAEGPGFGDRSATFFGDRHGPVGDKIPTV